MFKLLCFGLLAATVSLINAQPDKVVCYWATWASWRNGNGAFNVENMDAKKCTHMVLSFIALDGDGNLNTAIVDSFQFDNLAEWKEENNATTIVAMGGWNEGSIHFSQMASEAESRQNLVNNIVEFMKENKFDGFSIDWQYPTEREGSRPEDKENFTKLLQLLRKRFDKEGFLLTASVAGSRYYIDKCYDAEGIAENVDWINIMGFDFHGAYDGYTGHNAPLHHPGTEDLLNSAAAVERWIENGVPAEKIVLGIPAYGHSYTLVSPSKNGVEAATSGAGKAGPYLQTPGTLGYNEVCLELESDDWTIVFDKKPKVPYTYNGDQWISYDDVESVTIKAEYAIEKGLGGLMVSSLDTDDFRGDCSGGKYPILTAINEAFGL